MYVIRSILRAATGRPSARFIHGRRYPISRIRTFHSAHPLAQASNPPQTPGDTPIDQNGVKISGAGETAAEHIDGTVANEDPEVLAQKLQRSRESTRRYSAALRRQQRGKKAQGLPPVHIPDWFLKQRVVRREDVSPKPHDSNKDLPLFSVAVTHTETGEHATCSIPADGGFEPTLVLSQLVRGMWSRELGDEERRKVQKYIKGRTFSQSKKGAATLQKPNVDLVPVDPVITRPHGTIYPFSEGPSSPDMADSFDTRSRDPKSDPHKKQEAVMNQVEKAEKVTRQRAAARALHLIASGPLSSLVAAEVRATIAASLAAVQPELGDSFPAAKTNLILHSPTAEHEEVIERWIHTNAAELGSDVVTLNAQDLAQLAGDYLGEGPEPSPRSVRSLGYETYRLSAELNHGFEAIEASNGEESDFGQPSLDPAGSPQSFHLPIIAVSPALRALTQGLKNMHFSPASSFDAPTSVVNEETTRTQSQGELQLEDLKITSLLEALIDANSTKRDRGLVGEDSLDFRQVSDHSRQSTIAPAFFDYSTTFDNVGLVLNSALPALATPHVNLTLTVNSALPASKAEKMSKIIYVKDFKELNATHYGGRIIQKLEDLVRKRRASGESIMIIGTTCSRELTPELSEKYTFCTCPTPSKANMALAVSEAFRVRERAASSEPSSWLRI